MLLVFWMVDRLRQLDPTASVLVKLIHGSAALVTWFRSMAAVIDCSTARAPTVQLGQPDPFAAAGALAGMVV
jgi:hypothetical protein